MKCQWKINYFKMKYFHVFFDLHYLLLIYRINHVSLSTLSCVNILLYKSYIINIQLYYIFIKNLY